MTKPTTTEIAREALNYWYENQHISRHKISKDFSEKYGYSNPETLRKMMNKLRVRDEKVERHKAIGDALQQVGVPLEDVKHYWYKSKHFSAFVKEDEDKVDYISAIEDIVTRYINNPVEIIKEHKEHCEKSLKVTISDAHVGLNPNPDNKSLFAYEYNADIFKDNLSKVFQSIIKEYNANGRFDMLVIDDLGDGLDGWNGETTRGGHKLEQNMSNEEMFKTFVEGKLSLIEMCIKADIANEILVRNVSNDNHAGSFAQIANTTIKMILDRVYTKGIVDFYILERFMEHFTYGNHTFILTHGKDSKYMNRGLPFELNPTAINFINDYIEHYEIKTKYIHLEKGDLHRVGYSRTKKFDYRNYMSFAPPSAWVMSNFGDCYSGYSIQVVPKWNNEISHTDYYFELTKKS